MKIVDSLKEKKYVDERELWTAGVLKSLIGGAVGAIANMRYIAVYEETLYILKNQKKDFSVVHAIKKEDLVSISSKAGFLFLEVVLTIETKDFKEKYNLSSNKKLVKEIVKLFS